MVFEILNAAPTPGGIVGPSDPLRFDIRSVETLGQVAIVVRYPQLAVNELAYVGAPAHSAKFERTFEKSSSVSVVSPDLGFAEQWRFELRRIPRWISNPTIIVSCEGGTVGEPGPPGPPGIPGIVGPEGPAGSAPSGGTEDAPGYLSRTIYAHPASARVGTTHVGAVVQAAPTQWMTEDDIPIGNWFRIVVFGGGGGGGGGAAIVVLDDAQRGGGGGGGGARHPPVILPRAALVAALPIVPFAGLGGVGGAGGSRSIGGTTAGLEGTSGGASTMMGIGLVISAGAGFGGSVGTVRRGAGGGVHASATATAGGLPNDGFLFGSSAVRLLAMGGGLLNDRPVTGSAGTCYYCVNGGASGGAPTTVNTPFNGMNSLYGGCGGGHGGDAYSASYGQSRGYRPPSAGGGHDILSGTVGGGGGHEGSQPIGNGGDGLDGPSVLVGGEGGGGGGSYSSPGAPLGPGGSGGSGGFPGGGGAGGGTVYSAQETTSAGGNGGAGGDGCIIIDAFY